MRVLKFSVVFGLIISILLSMARFDALCGDLRENVFRLHIRAASDSEKDQLLKLKIRDALLNKYGNCFEDCADKSDAITLAQENIANIKRLAAEIVYSEGYDYDIKVEIGESYFENREYDDFTLPAGTYDALNIIIGEGKGKNWWCVMFPAVCVGASSELADSVNSESAEVAENSSDFKIRFKTVEIYENLKKIFKNNKK